MKSESLSLYRLLQYSGVLPETRSSFFMSQLSVDDEPMS